MFRKSRFLLADAPQSGFRFSDGPEGDDEAPIQVTHDMDFDYGDLPEVDGDTDEGNTVLEGTQKGSPDSDGKTVPSSSEFKPYEFKGKVNGEDIAQTFKNKKEMDVALARGIQAPQIYEALQAAKTDVAKYKDDAEWANSLQELARDDPEEFFDHVVEELIPVEKLASWVHAKYHEFSKLAAMSPEERQRELRAKEADKLLRERAHSEEVRKKAEEAQAQARVEQEKVKFASWQHKERQKWEAKLPEAARASLDRYFRMVALSAKAHLDSGKDYGYGHMTRDLADLLNPLVVNSQSPVQAKREEANNNRARNEAEKEKLRGMVNEQPQQKRMSKDDVWNNATRMAINAAREIKRR